MVAPKGIGKRTCAWPYGYEPEGAEGPEEARGQDKRTGSNREEGGKEQQHVQGEPKRERNP